MARIYLIIAILISFLFAYTDGEAKQEHVIQGHTMGTTYQVKVVTGSFQGVSGLKEKIENIKKHIFPTNSAITRGAQRE